MTAAPKRAGRPVTVLGVGGTISMAAGAQSGAVPALDAASLAAAVPALSALAGLQARTLLARPSAHLTLHDALSVAREAATVAAEGRGVVVTTGTDTLEELAVVCDLLCGGGAPIVLTGAMRPASWPGADGPANLVDAVAVAAEPATEGLGALVVFAGEIHAARDVRKVDATSPRAFASPSSGPLGHVAEGRVALRARPVGRRAPLHVERLDFSVPIVTLALGDDATLLQAALQGADGVVLVALGAGHLPVAALDVLREAEGVPIVACSRPTRGAILYDTYGFPGAEGDLRAAGAIPAGALSPPAARMRLLAGLGAGMGRADLAGLFAGED